MKTTALALLQRDKLLYADMIVAIEQNLATIEYAGEEGVALYYEHMTTYNVAVFGDNHDFFFNDFESKFNKEKDCFVTHDTKSCEIVKEKYSIRRATECYTAVYNKEEFPTPNGNCKIRVLEEKYIQQTIENYTLYDATEEITENIKKGKMLGAFVNEELAGFIGFHGEGSVGMLYVFPKFRRLKIGSDLLMAQLKLQREKGENTYTQIVTGNVASYKMHERLGFVFSDPTVVWLNM